MIASAEPIPEIETILHRSEDLKNRRDFNHVVQEVDRESDSALVIETRHNRGVVLEWPISTGRFTGAAEKIVIHHQ